MKKLILLAAFIACISSLSFGQVTLEHTYTSGSGAGPVLFSSNGEKYMVYDTATIYLYNTDHSLWKTIVPGVYPGYTMRSVFATSDNLFNSDNLVEIVVCYVTTDYSVHPYYKTDIINENAVVIQSLDSASYVTIHYNSTTNTYKLFATKGHASPTYDITDVYALPGTIPCNQCSSLGTERTAGSASQGIVISDPVPNPSAGAARIRYQLPNGISQATIFFYNMAGQLMRELPVLPNSSYIDINNSLFKPGTYAYLIRADNLVSETKTMTVQ